MILIGDHVLLLTGGIRCIKGDKAQVTKVTKTAVHLIRSRDTEMYKRYHEPNASSTISGPEEIPER